jgi:hypothetical protein
MQGGSDGVAGDGDVLVERRLRRGDSLALGDAHPADCTVRTGGEGEARLTRRCAVVTGRVTFGCPADHPSTWRHDYPPPALLRLPDRQSRDGCRNELACSRRGSEVDEGAVLENGSRTA